MIASSEVQLETERRQYPRIDLDAIVDYSGSAGVKCNRIKNISISGIRLEVSRPEQPGTQVSLSLTLKEKDKTIALTGQIAWARQAQPYEVGIRFLEHHRSLINILAETE